MQKTRVQSLGQEDPLEKEMATHSSILAHSRNPMDRRCLEGYSPWGCKRVRHDLAIEHEHEENQKLLWWGWLFQIYKFIKYTSVLEQLSIGKFGKGNDNPLQYSCLRNPMNRGTWQATVPRVAKEPDTKTERLNNNKLENYPRSISSFLTPLDRICTLYLNTDLLKDWHVLFQLVL